MNTAPNLVEHPTPMQRVRMNAYTCARSIYLKTWSTLPFPQRMRFINVMRYCMLRGAP